MLRLLSLVSLLCLVAYVSGQGKFGLALTTLVHEVSLE